MIAGTSIPPASIAELLPAELCARLDGLDLFSRRVFAGKLQGERRSKRRGRSVEFEEHREYIPGDDLRHIDWNVYARLDRFFIKLFQEEEDLGLELVLDASASMNAGTPGKLLFASRLAMGLAYVGLVRNNRVSMTIMGGPAGTRRLMPVRGRKNVQRLGEFLLQNAFAPGTAQSANAPTASELDATIRSAVSPAEAFTAGCRAVTGARQGKGVLVLLSDLLIPPGRSAGPSGRVEEGYQAGLRLLTATGAAGISFDTWCLQVLSPGELDPSKEGRGRSGDGESVQPIIGDLALTDVESGRIAEVTVTSEVLDAYRRVIKRYVDTAAEFCAARSAQHLLLSSDGEVSTIIVEALRRRGLLR